MHDLRFDSLASLFRRSKKQGGRPFAFEKSIEDRALFDEEVSQHLWSPRQQNSLECIVGQRVLSRYGEAELSAVKDDGGCVLTFRVGDAFARREY